MDQKDFRIEHDLLESARSAQVVIMACKPYAPLKITI